MSVPTFTDLSLYAKSTNQTSRYARLVDKFVSTFDAKPDFISRSPGRVNLIGDHIDYSYFSCLPMAIECDVLAAVKLLVANREIVITNTDPQFLRESFEAPRIGESINIDQNESLWGNYFKCAYIVAQKYLEENGHANSALNGLHITFDGNVSTGGGLSSSAAFCVASTMAILRANGIKEMTKADLTRITVVSEHYVGVNTGGLDQCASIYGEKDKALLVQFQPKLEGHAFAFPSIDMAFLITNSLVQANKKETAPVNYNLRAVEVAIAAEYLAATQNLQLQQDSNLETGTLRGFMDAYFKSAWDNDIDVGIKRLTEMVALVDKLFDTKELRLGVTTEEAAQHLNMSVTAFKHRFLSKFPVQYSKLKLYQRSKHVYTESLRVLQTLNLLRESRNAQERLDANNFLQTFGLLMDESQASLATMYDTSTDELNRICQIARANGSFGSRITGAGFGGSVVHLIRADDAANVTKALTEQYYRQRFPHITASQLDDAITISKPAIGTCIIEGLNPVIIDK